MNLQVNLRPQSRLAPSCCQLILLSLPVDNTETTRKWQPNSFFILFPWDYEWRSAKHTLLHSHLGQTKEKWTERVCPFPFHYSKQSSTIQTIQRCLPTGSKKYLKTGKLQHKANKSNKPSSQTPFHPPSIPPASWNPLMLSQ